MIFEYKEPDIDLLIKCLIENGCTITKAKDGEGGIYLKGKKLTDEELMDCLMNPQWDDELYDENLTAADKENK